MNSLLPRLDELFVITGHRNTFGDSKLQKNFLNLNFETKLQIVADLIRQTMLITDIPNPQCEFKEMKGDSYTASIVAINYMKECKIGFNHTLVLATKKPFQIHADGENNFVILVSDEHSNCYQVDCTPTIGYCHGKVRKIEDGLFYSNYYYLDNNYVELLQKIRQLIYDISISKVEDIQIKLDQNKYLIQEIKKYDVFENYILLLEQISNKNFFRDNKKKNLKLVLVQIEIWKSELSDLISKNENIERQVELAQWINHEYLKYFPEKCKTTIINGRKVNFTELTPRFFFEEQLNCVIIKPSTYYINKSEVVKKNLIGKKNTYGEYLSVLGGRSKNGIRIMYDFHPDGYKYERSMLGPCDIMLVHEHAKKLQERKAKIREELLNEMKYKIVNWFDNKPFYWDPIIANFIHTTDNSCEVACHYLSAFPEYQIMNRFMYPNPKLIY